MAEIQPLTYKIEEVAKLLGVSLSTAYLMARSGEIPALRLHGKRLVVPRVALENFLATAGKPGVGVES